MLVLHAARRLTPSVFLALAALSTGSAAADDDTTAEQTFQEGRALMLEGRFAEACPKIAESQRLDPHLGTLLNLAACHEKMGRVGSAWVEYQQALTTAQAEGQVDRERLAKERIATLEPRVPWLTLSVALSSAAHGLAITLDGAPILPLAWGKEMPTDPGPHVVVTTAPNFKPTVDQFDLKESERKTVSVPTLEAIGPASQETPAPPKPTVIGSSPKTETRSRWVLETGLFTGFLSLNADHARLSDPGSIELRDFRNPSASYSDCDHGAGCTGTIPGTGGALVGANVYAAYALSDRMQVGARILAGPRLGGGMLLAVGPSLSVHVTGPVWTGAALYIADARASAEGTVTGRGGYSPTSTDRVPMEASVSGPALGIDLSVRLLDFPRGSLVAGTHPLFILSGPTSSAFALPLSLSYRFY